MNTVISIDNDFVLIGTECIHIDAYHREFILGLEPADVTRDEILMALKNYNDEIVATHTSKTVAKIALVTAILLLLFKIIIH